MESKNEDSFGSDSLDRSLKKKCVVVDSEDEKEDEVHPPTKVTNIIASNIPLRNDSTSPVGSSSVKKASDSIKCESRKSFADANNPSDNCDFAGQNDLNSEHICNRTTEPVDNLQNIKSTKEISSLGNKTKNDETAINVMKVQNVTNNKTEHGNDDTGGDDDGGGNRIVSALDPVELALPTCSTKSRRKADVDDTSTSSDDSQKQASASSTKSFGDLDLNDDDDGETTDSTIDNKSQDSKSFASKVKQISENLQGTTLGDECDEQTDTKKTKANSLEDLAIKDDNDTSSSSSSDNDKTLTEESSAHLDAAAYTKISNASKKETCIPCEEKYNESSSDIEENKSNSHYAVDTSRFSDCSSRSSSRLTINSKHGKVEKLSSDDENDDTITNNYHKDSEGEDEEDEDEEFYPDDDEEALMTAISRRLSMRPLSFTSPYTKNNTMPREPVDAEDETLRMELQRELPPENGIQKILGKHMHCGETQYLFRWVEKPGLHWETEEFLRKTCPALIKKYEKDRELEREQHVRYLNGRKKSRQRFNM